MTAPKYETVKPEYEALWASMTIRPEKVNLLRGDAAGLIRHKPSYQIIEKRTSVKWFIVALIHEMECGGNFALNIAQGDPWNKVSVHVPAGRGPFASFEDAAVDALHIDGTSSIKDWGIARVCYELEKYNGFGTRSHGVHTPYLWSYSNHYGSVEHGILETGKYVSDHNWDPKAISQQGGAMPLLKTMMEMDASVSFGVTPEVTKEQEAADDAWIKANVLGGKSGA